MKKAYDTKIPLPRIRHFERKREIFFVRGKTKDVRGAASGKHPAPCAPEERCFMQTDSRMKQKMANEKDPSTPLGMTIRETAFLIFPFIPRREPTSAPSGRLLPSEGGRMPPQRLLMQKAFDTRIPLPPSFRAKARNLFVRGKAKDVRGTASGKHRTPCAPQKRCFMQTVPHRKRNTANEKDSSAALGMTIREYSFPQRRCEITIISFSRSICLGGLAALIGVTGKPYPRYLSYHSHPIRPCGAPSPRGEGLRYENTIF